MILSGALPAAALALLVDGVLAGAERLVAPAHLRQKRRSNRFSPEHDGDEMQRRWSGAARTALTLSPSSPPGPKPRRSPCGEASGPPW
jgi:hypothetical protein